MIPEYKMYHGAVLIDLIGQVGRPVTVQEGIAGGRGYSYIIDGRICLLVKHSSNRLRPWGFTFTQGNMSYLASAEKNYGDVFCALVCWADGLVLLNNQNLRSLLGQDTIKQSWIRVDRCKRQWYQVNGSSFSDTKKIPNGISELIQALAP